MVTGMLGKKLGMTRLFLENGQSTPVTVIEVEPCTVVQVKTADKDAYAAAQIGVGTPKSRKLSKPLRGHFDKHGVEPKRTLCEFALAGDDETQPGDEVKVDQFAPGDYVNVSGTSKGKGFQGVVKRHGFGGGPASHGSKTHRAPGAIGMSADPSRVLKGKRMPGRMGRQRVTARNLEVIRVEPDKNLLIVRGCVPGANGGSVEVRKAAKSQGTE